MDNQNTKIFKSFYSEFYDLIYEDKSYEDECNRIKDFLRYKKKIQNILELGCGTCGHSMILSKNGYNIHAIDQSDEMLEIASKKIKKEKIFNIKLFKGNIENLKLTKFSYDVILLLFNVVGYLKNIDNFFSSIKKFVKKDTLIIFDFWHDNGVHFEGPKKISKTFRKKNLELIKQSYGSVNKKQDCVEIIINTTLKKQKKIISQSNESHFVKYYNINFLNKIISSQGFEVIKFEDFKKEGYLPNKKNWSVYCICKFLG